MGGARHGTNKRQGGASPGRASYPECPHLVNRRPPPLRAIRFSALRYPPFVTYGPRHLQDSPAYGLGYVCLGLVSINPLDLIYRGLNNMLCAFGNPPPTSRATFKPYPPCLRRHVFDRPVCFGLSSWLPCRLSFYKVGAGVFQY
jgi:hypothetical protein